MQSFPVIIKSKEKHKLLANTLPIEREITSEWKDRVVHAEMNNVVMGGQEKIQAKLFHEDVLSCP